MNTSYLKTCWLALLAAVLIPFGTQTNPLQAAETVRVVAWNIEWFPGLTLDPTAEAKVEHMALVQTVLQGIDPDILLASEIRDWQSFYDLTMAVPGLQPAVVSAFRSKYGPGFWPQQLAVASRLPVEAAWSEAFRYTYVSQVRGFSMAVIRVPNCPDNKVLLAYALHLKSNRARDDEQTLTNYRMREDAIAQLLAHIDEMERLAFPDRIRGIIVGGDFNTNHDGQFGDITIEMMEQAGFHNSWQNVAREDRLSWRGSERFQPTTFDYIFTRGLGTPTAVLLEVPDGSSDHWPVQIEIILD